MIHTTKTGDESNKEITAAYDASGKILPEEQWQIMNVDASAPNTGQVQAIINTRKGGSVSWASLLRATKNPIQVLRTQYGR